MPVRRWVPASNQTAKQPFVYGTGGIRKIDVTFATYDPSGSPGEVVLRTPIRKAEKLVEGMKGRLCYRGTTFLSFFP